MDDEDEEEILEEEANKSSQGPATAGVNDGGGLRSRSAASLEAAESAVQTILSLSMHTCVDPSTCLTAWIRPPLLVTSTLHGSVVRRVRGRGSPQQHRPEVERPLNSRSLLLLHSQVFTSQVGAVQQVRQEVDGTRMRKGALADSSRLACMCFQSCVVP